MPFIQQMEHIGSHLSSDPEETVEIGRMLGLMLCPGHVVGLVGELGAGKTCFVQGVSRGLEVDPRVYVSSPTFTLVNEYPGRLTLYHIDLYRLSDPDELVEIGLDEYYRSDGACLVEWFDRFPHDTPPHYLELRFEVLGDTQRRLDVWATGEQHAALGRRWTSGLDDEK